MDPYFPRTLASVFVAALLIAGSSCTHSSDSTAEPESSRETPDAGKEEPSPPPTPGGDEPEAVSPARADVPDAIRELQEKIQPKGSSPPDAGPRTARGTPRTPTTTSSKEAGKADPASEEPPPEVDEEALLEESKTFIAKLVESIQKRDRETAASLMFDREMFARVVSPGIRDIVEGQILSGNARLLDRLLESLGGKQLEPVWEPEKVVVTKPPSPYVVPCPTINRAVLEVNADGAHVEILMDQLVYVDGSWHIFRFSTP